MKTAELTVERTVQGWRVSRLGTDGYYQTRHFIGYTKAESIRRFKLQLSAVKDQQLFIVSDSVLERQV